jgi:hypothetical protein
MWLGVREVRYTHGRKHGFRGALTAYGNGLAACERSEHLCRRALDGTACRSGLARARTG